MAYRRWNPNPNASRVGDCAVRAVARALHMDWERAYTALALQGFVMRDMPSSNHVWGTFLKTSGFRRSTVPNECPDCYTVRDFAREHPEGVYVLGLSGHVVTIEDGDWYDTWDSGEEAPIYYWERMN